MFFANLATRHPSHFITSRLMPLMSDSAAFPSAAFSVVADESSFPPQGRTISARAAQAPPQRRRHSPGSGTRTLGRRRHCVARRTPCSTLRPLAPVGCFSCLSGPGPGPGPGPVWSVASGRLAGVRHSFRPDLVPGWEVNGYSDRSLCGLSRARPWCSPGPGPGPLR